MTVGWLLVARLAHLLAACAAATLATWLAGRRSAAGTAGTALVGALVCSAVWATLVAATGFAGRGTDMAESVRNLAWLCVVYRLFSSDGRHTLVRPIRPVVIALASIELFQLLQTLAAPGLARSGATADMLFHMTVMFRLMFSIGGLVLLHNLYAGASDPARSVLHWPALATALLWLFDLNLYTVAYLTDAWPSELAALRGLTMLAVVAAWIPGLTRRRAELRFGPSRAVAFELVSLLGIGLYLLAMVVLGKWLSFVGGQYVSLLKFAFLIGSVAAAALVLPSRRMRGWLKVTLVKHLFRHRYDYRAEWLRFNRTIGRAGSGSAPLEQRAIQSLCDITDSPAGLLLAPDDHGELVLAARWQWRTADVPAPALGAHACAFFERLGHIVDLDAVRSGADHQGEAQIVPDWLLAEPAAWALVPLVHYERLVGAVVLARPALARTLDWEDFDLLRVVGQQLASYLAEHSSQDALAQFAQRHPVTVTAENEEWVSGSAEALEQALVHLIQNAVDASPPDRAVTVTIDREAESARIEIADSGAGMSPEFVRNQLFKPFVSAKAGGFGIGAFEARELVRAMGGRLDVASREGIGSRFLIRLPLAARPHDSIPQKVA